MTFNVSVKFANLDDNSLQKPYKKPKPKPLRAQDLLKQEHLLLMFLP